MVTIQNSLKITLKSDLCAGSGFSYAGLIDSDISYDKYGVPFISGRRLKGCMKESAYMIKTDQAQISDRMEEKRKSNRDFKRKDI